MNRRNSIIVLFLLITTITSLSYAFWDILNRDQKPIVDIGKGMEIIVSVNTEDEFGKTLIPDGAVLGENDVYNYTITYHVRLNKYKEEPMILNVRESNVKIGGETLHSELVNIVIILDKSTVNVQNVLVTVIISLLEPPSKEVYDVIVNKQISFDLIFSASL